MEVETVDQMKKKVQFLGIFILVLAGFGKSCWAQSDKMMFHGGFAYQFVTVKAEFQPVSARQLNYLYGLTGGMNYILAHSNDQVSIGINPNANLGFSFINTGTSTGVAFLGQVPVFLLARLGANATPYNSTKVGIGAGLGTVFSYWYASASGFNQISEPFYNPSAMAELNIKGRSSDYSLRFNWSLYRPKSEIDGLRYEMGTSAFSIVYSF